MGRCITKKAIKLLYEVDEKLDHERVIEIISKWKPYQITACIMLWKWIDEGAVKFS